MHDTQDLSSGPGFVRCADDGSGVASRVRPSLSAGRVLAAFALTSDVEALIDARLAELRLVIPLLAPWRGRLSGHRVLGARAPSEHGDKAEHGVIRGVTRVDIEFEVEVDAEAPGVVALACHSTVRGRDRETTRTRIALPGTDLAREPGEADLHRVSEWVEDALLVFAADWFEARRVRPAP